MRQDKVIRPSTKGTCGGCLLFEVTQDMRLTLGDRSEQLLIGLISQGVNTGEVTGQIAPSTKSRQEFSEALPIAFALEPSKRGNGMHDGSYITKTHTIRLK